MRKTAAPALPSLFDDAAPPPVAVKAAPVKAAKTAAPKPVAVKPVAVKPAAVKPVAVKAAPKAVAAKPTPKPAPAARTVKKIPVTAAPAPPAPVRVLAETSGAAGRAWRLGGRYAIAYLMDAGLAGELLATEPKGLAKAAMAVYYDRKGKAFAWQVRFDAERWDEVVGRLG